MNCPHCQKELPEDYSAMWCPFCAKYLTPKAEPPPPLPSAKLNWRIFLCALLGPALLTLISAATMRFLISPGSMNEAVTPYVVFICGPIGGVICGVMLGFQGGRNLPVRIILSLVMVTIMIPVCVVLCFFGCGIGGYQMRIGG
jgi:hypothetical protein